MDPSKARCTDLNDPFKDLKVKSWMILEGISERQPCVTCNKSRKYFCYNCCIPVQSLEGHVPIVKVRFVLCCIIVKFICEDCSLMRCNEPTMFYCSCPLRQTLLNIHEKQMGKVLLSMQQFWHRMMSIFTPTHVYQIMGQMRG